jgi:sterol 3beta-glucosyltransferase
MKIAIACNDTRGGVQPYVALAQGLAEAGHDVRAVAPAEFAPMFANISVPMHPLSGGEHAEKVRSTGIAEQGIIATMRMMARELPAQINQWTRETLAACEGVDVITGGVGGMVMGLSVAEKLSVPFIETHLQPLGVRTNQYPGIMLPWMPRWLGKKGLHFSHYLSDKAAWMAFKRPMDAARKNVLGLRGQRLSTVKTPVLYGFSPHVLDVPMHDERVRYVTGYWTLPASQDWQAPSDLETFIARGEPLVSIGFGSMASSKPEELTELVLGAVKDAGVSAVLLSGWGGLRSFSSTKDVFFAESVPHDWLFPHMNAIVHHGGAGTTGAAFAAGVPQIIIPFTADQPFWGMRAEALGCGVKPIPRKRLSRKLLADALRLAVNDKIMGSTASNLGCKVRKEDGVARSVQYFNQFGNGL